MRCHNVWLLAASSLLACSGNHRGNADAAADAAAAATAAVDSPLDLPPPIADGPDAATGVDGVEDLAVVGPRLDTHGFEAPLPALDAAPDLRPAPSGAPLPGGVTAPRRLLDPAASLTGQGPSGCSHQPPAPGQPAGDRWCSVMKPGAVAGTELWVLNLSEAARAAIPPCDGSTPDCRRLTANLWTSPAVLGGPIHPYSHEFHGDTLIFYADALSAPNEVFRGPVYAWRPGWAEARRISSPRAVICWGHPERPLAHCLNDFVGPVMRPESIQLGAGPIADVPNIVLPALPFMRGYRPGSILAWEAGFSPRGDSFALSSPDPDPDVEAVRVVPTTQLDSGTPMPAEILRDANSWDFSPTGQKIFFFRPEGADARGLWAADFPSGANVTKLVAGLRDYIVLGDRNGDKGIAYLVDLEPGKHALRLMNDIANPAGAVTVFNYEDQLEGIALSGDLRFTAWGDSRFNLRVVRHADLVSCDLNTNPRHDAFSPSFLENGALVFWKEDSDQGPDRLDGYLANPDGCTGKRRFGLAVDFTIPIGDQAVVFGDELVEAAGTVTLKYVRIAGGNEWPAGDPIRIRDRVDSSSVFVVSENPLMIIFRSVGATPAAAETFLFGPIP